MSESLTVSGAARELSQRLGVVIRPRDITNLFYNRRLDDDLCPIVAGRRLIARETLRVIEHALRGQPQNVPVGKEAK